MNYTPEEVQSMIRISRRLARKQERDKIKTILLKVFKKGCKEKLTECEVNAIIEGTFIGLESMSE